MNSQPEGQPLPDSNVTQPPSEVLGRQPDVDTQLWDSRSTEEKIRQMSVEKCLGRITANAVAELTLLRERGILHEQPSADRVGKKVKAIALRRSQGSPPITRFNY